ncbi:MAG: hypothetical protein R3F19_16465 [Verrucomicrobiales bacterium]
MQINKSPIVRAVAIGIAGLAIGWNLRTHSARPLPQIENAALAKSAERNDSSLARASLNDVLGSLDGDDKRPLVRFLTTANLADIEQLIVAMTNSPVADAELLLGAELIALRAADIDVAAFYEWLLQPPINGHHYLYEHLQSLTLRAWALRNPRAAVVGAASADDDVRSAMIANLSDADAADVLALAIEHWPDSSLLAELKKRHAAWLAKQNPELAMAEALKFNGSGPTVHEVIAEWARTAPKAAWDWLHQPEQMSQFGGSMFERQIITHFAEKDAAAAIQMFSQLPKNESNRELEPRILRQWSKQDFDAAVSWALEEPNPLRRGELLRATAAELGKSDPERLLRLYSDRNIVTRPYGMSDEIQAAARSIAKDDPALALRYLSGMERAPVKEIATTWAAADPPAAARWAETIPMSQFRENVLNPVIQTWSNSTPKEAAEFVSQMDQDREAYASKVTESWTVTDPDAALAWAAGIGEDTLLDAVYQTTSISPAKAATFVDDMPDTSLRAKAIARVTESWRFFDPQATMEWLTTRERDPINAIAASLENTARQWVNDDPATASTWIGNMADGPERDYAAAGIVASLIESPDTQPDYVSATAWADGISDAALRDRWLLKIRDQLEGEPAPNAKAP